jgi:PqqD family protein of HPr-rel-A system
LSKKWKLSRRSDVHLKEWDEEFVVYNGFTASTHLLGPAAAAVLLTVIESDTAVTVTDLLDHLGLSGRDGHDVPAGGADAVGSILNELEQIELIEVATA